MSLSGSLQDAWGLKPINMRLQASDFSNLTVNRYKEDAENCLGKR